MTAPVKVRYENRRHAVADRVMAVYERFVRLLSSARKAVTS